MTDGPVTLDTLAANQRHIIRALDGLSKMHRTDHDKLIGLEHRVNGFAVIQGAAVLIGSTVAGWFGSQK